MVRSACFYSLAPRLRVFGIERRLLSFGPPFLTKAGGARLGLTPSSRTTSFSRRHGLLCAVRHACYLRLQSTRFGLALHRRQKQPRTFLPHRQSLLLRAVGGPFFVYKARARVFFSSVSPRLPSRVAPCFEPSSWLHRAHAALCRLVACFSRLCDLRIVLTCVFCNLLTCNCNLRVCM